MDPEKAYSILRKRFVDFLIEWHEVNVDEYNKNKKGFDKASDGDFSMYEQLFSLALSCVPNFVMNECLKLFGNFIDKPHTEEYAEFEEAVNELVDFDGFLKIYAEGEDWDMDFVSEKEEADTTSLYIRIKGEYEWWQSIPMQYKMIAQLMLMGKPEKDIAHQARRVIIAAWLSLPETLDKLCDLAKTKKDPALLSALYYFMVEHGFRKSAKVLGGMIATPNLAMFIPSLITNTISKMTETSLKGGYDKKADWKKDFGKEENKDARHAVLEAIDETQAKHGRHRVEQGHYNIDDYLIGDKPRLKEEILNFLNKMSHDSDIAYLWKVLDETCHLKDVSFPDFHRALEGFWERDIKYDRAQRLFTKLAVNKKEFEVATNRAAREGRALISKWMKVFEVIPL